MAETGRPPTYKPEFAEQARKLCTLGATDEEIAKFFEVCVRTVYRWKHDHDAFCQALKAGKAQADDRVERSLYHRALGYQHEDVHVSNYQGEITVTPLVKYYPPDTTAGIFWLKNRRPDEWRDKQDHEHTGRDGGPLLEVNDTELAQRVASLLVAAAAGGNSGSGD